MKFLKSIIEFFKRETEFFYLQEQQNYERQMERVKSNYRKAG